METRRHTKELQAQRELADTAEASRFVELRGYLTTELRAGRKPAPTAHGELLNRMNHLEGALRLTLEQTANSVAAAIGELEDRLERATCRRPRSRRGATGRRRLRR